MIYKSFCGEKVSALGLGCMRLPQTEDKKIDEKALAEMVKAAFEGGVNYFDTAWGYHGGQSEGAVGRALAAYPRDSFFLATKFPGYDVANMDRAPEIFQTQLSRCGVEYFDFYLCHNVNETNIDLYLDPKFGIVPYLVEQKKQGRIRHLGFSAHGTVPTIRRFLEAYGEHMEFCQIQVNYLDWKIIQAEKKVALLKEWGLPVLAMEPVRGGKLIQLDETIAAPLRAMHPQRSLAQWAFRFVQSVPEVGITLSGMSNLEQLKENIEIFSQNQPLSEEDRQALYEAARALTAKTSLPCTGCAYCTEHCPQKLDIPHLMDLYNEFAYTNTSMMPAVVAALPEGKKPYDCIGCGNCSPLCPQGIDVPGMMQAFCQKLKEKEKK